MRFETRYDGWIVTVLAAEGMLFVILPLAFYFNHVMPGGQLWLFLIGPLVMALVLFLTLPQYYEVREDGLFIRQGWRKALLPYAALREMHADDGVLSAPVFSTHRVYLSADPGRQWVLAVKEQDQFLAEVKRHAPQLK